MGFRGGGKGRLGMVCGGKRLEGGGGRGRMSDGVWWGRLRSVTWNFTCIVVL